jgi:transcription elongation GreA/GreB family factor
MSLPNRHPVDELADLRMQKREIEQRIEELRELIISGACGLIGDEHTATLKVRTGKRVDIKELQRAFGAKAVAPFVRQHRATYVIIQEFEND